MTLDRAKNSLFSCLLFATCIGFAQVKSPETSGPQIKVERLERVSHDEVQFRVRVTNRTDGPIFLTAVNYELMGFKGLGAHLDPVYLEQWRTKEGWSIVAPCMDTPPPDVIKMNPGETMTVEPVLRLPLSSVCKVRNIQLEGKFRFRVEYFESEKHARAYIEKLFSPQWKKAYAPAAVSEPFEIPPPPNPISRKHEHATNLTEDCGQVLKKLMPTGEVEGAVFRKDSKWLITIRIFPPFAQKEASLSLRSLYDGTHPFDTGRCIRCTVPSEVPNRAAIPPRLPSLC